MNEFSANDSSATTDTTAEILVRVGDFTAEDSCILEEATAPRDNTITSLSGRPFKQEVARALHWAIRESWGRDRSLTGDTKRAGV